MKISEVLSEFYKGCEYVLMEEDYETLKWLEINKTPKPSLEELEQKWQEILLEKPMKLLRQERDKRLAETDKYTSIPDWPHPTEEAKQAWLDYRQALRDLPSNTTNPDKPKWPFKPGFPIIETVIEVTEIEYNQLDESDRKITSELKYINSSGDALTTAEYVALPASQQGDYTQQNVYTYYEIQRSN